MSKKKAGHRNDVAGKVAKSLQEFGYPDATPKLLQEVVDAFCDGKRGTELPHGILGLMAERTFLEVEEANPSYFKQLRKD